MEELKLGDIRKFDNGVIGVVCNTSNGPYYEVIEPNGNKRMIPQSCTFTIPKLKPEIRSMLNAVSDAIINCEEKRKAVSEAYVASSRATENLNALVERLKTFDQEMTLKEFENALIRNMGPKYNKICDRGYNFNLSFNSNSLDLKLLYRTMVKKYATPENTSYVSTDYDGRILFERSTEAYSKEIKRNSCLCLPFITSGIKGVLISDDKDLSAADKNTIFFNHKVHFCFLGAKLTEEMAAKVAKSIQIQK